MRATRNVVIAFVLLFIGLFFTSAHMFINAGSTPATKLSANLSVSEGSEAIPDMAVIPEKEGRDSFVAMMKQELARRVDKIIVPAPIEISAEGETAEDENALVDEAENREIIWCDATVLEAQFVASWPKDVQVLEREGARVVLAPSPALDTASGTVTQSPMTLMQFPLRPVSRSEPACLTNGYVGVTPDGRLIHNNDVILYKGYAVTALVGYAFDGNPIYGSSDSTKLDSCGGQNTASGYRYNLRADENFILGCFMSEPQQVQLGG
jgi:hypothetical protein